MNEYPTAALLLWKHAGRPLIANELEPHSGPCFTCGRMSPGLGRPVDDRYQRRGQPPDPTPIPWPTGKRATHHCAVCAWTTSDWVPMPPAEGMVRLARAFPGTSLFGDAGPSVGEDDEASADTSMLINGVGVKVTIKLEDGMIGVYPRPAKKGSDRIALLTAEQASRLIVTKFRNWDHLAVDGRWRIGKVVKATDRDWFRHAALNPPAALWAMVLGDGQKHFAIKAVVSDGCGDLQTVHHAGQNVTYDPVALCDAIEALENLRKVGIRDDDILVGRVAPSHLQRAAFLRWWPTLAPHTTTPFLALAVALGRLAKEIPDAVDRHPVRLAAPGGSAEPVGAAHLPLGSVDAGQPPPADRAPPPVAVGPRDDAPGRPGPDVGKGAVGPVQPAQPHDGRRQLSLFR